MSSNFIGGVILAAVVAVVGVGCDSKSDPKPDPAANGNGNGNDGDDHNGDHQEPASYEEAVTALGDHMQTVQLSLSSGDDKSLDNALHEVLHIGGHMSELATKAGLEGDALSAVETATESLLDVVQKIHDESHLHGDKPEGEEDHTFDYTTVAADVTTALDALKSHVGAAGE